jgi:hypothetical protein
MKKLKIKEVQKMALEEFENNQDISNFLNNRPLKSLEITVTFTRRRIESEPFLVELCYRMPPLSKEEQKNLTVLCQGKALPVIATCEIDKITQERLVSFLGLSEEVLHEFDEAWENWLQNYS